MSLDRSNNNTNNYNDYVKKSLPLKYKIMRTKTSSQNGDELEQNISQLQTVCGIWRIIWKYV